MALGFKKKFFLAFALMTFLLLAGAGTFAYFLTKQLELSYSQDPNPVEEHEAKRKLNLFNEAQSEKRKGFIRLSEVEINSFLDSRYNNDKSRTNDPVRLVKASVLLTSSNLTLVTSHAFSVMGLEIPLLWQRVVTPREVTNGWSFTLKRMQIGDLEVPERFWPEVEDRLGATDAVFQERKVWLDNVPEVRLTQNEVSHAPELRLYTYIPPDRTAR